MVITHTDARLTISVVRSIVSVLVLGVFISWTLAGKLGGLLMRLSSTGTRNGANKLTELDVKMIRIHREEGLSRPKVAKMFGVGKYTIRDIDYGYTWNWLE